LEIDARAIALFYLLALGNAFTSMALLLKNARGFGKFPQFPDLTGLLTIFSTVPRNALAEGVSRHIWF
jgi:hypothetical protein